MKIVHIINNLDIGGAEKLLVELLPLLRRKEDVKVALLNSSGTPLYNQLVSEIGADNILTLSGGSLYNLIYILKVRKFLKEYDVVHVHLFPALYYVGIAAYLFGKKAKLIFTEHGTSNRRINSKVYNLIDRLIYKKFDTIIAITPGVKTVLEKSLALYGKVNLIYNGINLDKIEQASAYEREQFFCKNSEVLLIQVSRFSYEKDQKTAIKSLLTLPLNVKLIFIGDGIHRKDCELLVNEMQLEKRVLFLGSRTDVPQLLKMSDMVIQSSFSEGFGLAALEGMAAGKPVIASDIPGLRTVIGDAGLVFEMGNSVQLANQIQSLINDPDYYAHISNKCLERAKLFSINNTAEQLLNLYEKT
jgi:glycosyltransferase involved in cell wall biosynthesis